jgi:hypothetical protein
MPYIFVDDGMPDAREWDNNYITYDEDNMESMLSALELLETSERAKKCELTVQKRVLERSIEKKKAEIGLTSSSSWETVIDVHNGGRRRSRRSRLEMFGAFLNSLL